MSNTQLFLAQNDEGLHLVVNERVGIVSLKLVEGLDEVAVTMLGK